MLQFSKAVTQSLPLFERQAEFVRLPPMTQERFRQAVQRSVSKRIKFLPAGASEQPSYAFANLLASHAVLRVGFAEDRSHECFQRNLGKSLLPRIILPLKTEVDERSLLLN